MKFTRRTWMAAIVALYGLFLFAHPRPCMAQETPVAAASIDTDRWMEIDMYWFKLKDIPGSVHEFWDRFEPLFAGVTGYRGVILNMGWTVGPVMEWSGNLDQRMSLPAGTGQSRWVDEHELLTGTTAQRKQESEARFAKPVDVQRRGYDPWTYGDVKRLAAALKEEAARRQIAGFKVGILNYAWTHAYGEEAPWVRRHPEAFANHAFTQPGNYGGVGRYFDPGNRLHADPSPLGGMPGGIAEGTPVHQAYAAQWGSLSRSLGLDAVMLRDSFGMPVPYQRSGPWGIVAPSPELIRKATQDVSALVRETKLANPDALVMMYSNAASAISDWRSNGLDLETIARQGYLDIWVDQTWAGAWNEVGIREGAFWNTPTLGWTYQLAYMLTHAAVLAPTKVRHYPMIETFDAWESWDVIHSAPQRLRWGIWAYSHAAVKTPEGLKLPVGSYISWANQGERLLSQQDVQFLAGNINAAVQDAREMKDVLGPTLVYARDSMQWQAEHASPGHDVNEWIDEQAGSVIKWPVPILSITRTEWLPQVKSDLFILQTPSHLPAQETEALTRLIQGGQPVAIFGSTAGGIDKTLGELAGLRSSFAPAQEQVHLCDATNLAPETAKSTPLTFKTFCAPGNDSASPEARVIYRADGFPALTLDVAGKKRVAVWNPPDLRSRSGMPLSEVWGNTGAPYALAAGVLNDVLKTQPALHASEIYLRQTMNVAAWRTKDGTLRILAANLEEGLRDDADITRHATLSLPESWKIGAWKDRWSGQNLNSPGNLLTIDLPQAASVLLEPAK